jgi:predicted phosphodiesterase
MKLAILTDIHANFLALQAVTAHLDAWQPDRVVVAGDIVNRGPRPAECLRLIQAKQEHKGWQVVRGNHEDYVISQADPKAPRTGHISEVHRASYWTYQQIGYDISNLEAMPFQVSFPAPDGSEVRVVHASMTGNRDGIYPETTDEELAPKIGYDPELEAPPALFCVGHTHRPLIRRLNGTLVVNAGSSGLPFDGDTRPSYAQMTWRDGCWDAKIVRIPYNLKEAEMEFTTAGYLEGGGPLVQLVLIELMYARSQLYNWAIRYQKRALNGEITMEESVREFLKR